MDKYAVIAIPVDVEPTRDELNNAIQESFSNPDKVPIACESRSGFVRVYKLGGLMLDDNDELTDEGFETLKKAMEDMNGNDG